MPHGRFTTKLYLGLGLVALLVSQPAIARNVFLNGTDISSARSQELKNVNIVINEKGDVFILAPHYQVNEEDTYVPLSKYVQGLNQPLHKSGSPGQNQLPGHPAAPTAKGAYLSPAETPVQFDSDGQVKKAGDDVPSESLPTGMDDKSTEDKSD